MNKLYSYILLLFLGTMSFACSSDIDEVGDVTGKSPMTMTFSAPAAPKKGRASVTSLQDGSVIRDLAVFISKENGEVVAYRCITGITEQTLLRFDMSKTATDHTDWVRGLDGAQITGGTRYSTNIQPPTKGEYHIYAVANFSENTEINTVISNANKNLTATNLETQLTNLKAKTINSGTNSLCDSKKPMVLSMYDVLHIGPGENHHTSHLLRTYTRIKVTVRNESYKYPLKVHNLHFTNITRQHIPLFVMPGYTPGVGDQTPNVKADGALGTNSLAIVPLAPNTEIAKNGSENNKAVVFDGYILESSAVDKGRDTKYSFVINVTGVGATTTVRIYKQEKASSVMSESNYNQDIPYLIKLKNENNYFYLKESNDVVIKKPLPAGDLVINKENTRYVWKKPGYATTSIVSEYLHNEDAKYKYMDGKSSGPITFQNGARDLTTKDNSIYWGKTGNWHYIKSDLTWISSIYWNYSEAEVFTFVPLTPTDKTETSAPVNAGFTFTKQVNDKSEIVRRINRNDFYNIFINVRYNETSKTFDFSVEGWDDVNLGIEFN